MDEQKEQVVEDILYGLESPTIDVFDSAQYRESKVYWDDAQLLKELSFHAGYKKLFHMAVENSKLHARLRRQYQGVDATKNAELLLNERKADAIVEFLRAQVDDAVNTPRPVLHQQ
jgi:hypothetical protein